MTCICFCHGDYEQIVDLCSHCQSPIVGALAPTTPREAVVSACTPRWRKIVPVLEQAWRANPDYSMRTIRAALWDALKHEQIEINLLTAKVRSRRA